MPHTKKVGTSGRFGARYGKKLRAKIAMFELEQKIKQRCPYCKKLTVKRLAAGIYFCKSCSAKFTGKAYKLT